MGFNLLTSVPKKNLNNLKIFDLYHVDTIATGKMVDKDIQAEQR